MESVSHWKTGSYINWLVLIAAALGGIAATLSSPVITVLAIGGLLWMTWLFKSWPVAGLMTIIVAISVPRYAYTVGGLTVIAERVVLPVLAAILVLSVLTAREPRFRLGWGHVGIAIFLVANAVGSLLNAPDTTGSLRLTLLIAIASLPYWILPNLMRDGRSVRFAFYLLLALGALEAAFGIFVTIVYSTMGTNLGVQIDPLTGAAVPYGSQWEGNTFGSFIAATLIAALGWQLGSKRFLSLRFKDSAVMHVAVAIMVVGLVFSLSRGAWLGAVAGLVVVLICLNRWKVLVGGAVVCVGLLVMATVLQTAQVVDGPLSPLMQRLTRIVAPLQGNLDATTFERFSSYGVALDEWRERPLVGWGAGSFGQMHTYASIDEPAWLDNLEIHALHDSGMIGLVGLTIALIGPLLGLFLKVRRYPAGGNGELGVMVGLLGACVVLLVAFQATEATWLGYPWCFWGLAWAAGMLSVRPAAGGIDVVKIEATGRCE